MEHETQVFVSNVFVMPMELPNNDATHAAELHLGT